MDSEFDLDALVEYGVEDVSEEGTRFNPARQSVAKKRQQAQGWITQRLEQLAKVFAVECCDDAVLDNHLHLILRNRPDVAQSWSAEEVARRWLLLNRSTLELEAEPTSQEIDALVSNKLKIAELRARLSSISWYMGSLNDPPQSN